MPIYEYLCQACDTVEDRILPVSHDPQECNECGMEMQKQLSLFGFVFNDSSQETMTKKQKKHAQRCRENFVKHDREEAIARGGTEWKSGTSTEDIAKSKPNKWGTPRTASERLLQS